MRTLRADNTKLATDMTRLSDRNAEIQRRVDIADSSDTSLRSQLKSAEAAARGLKDEVARTKALVNQVRSTCATDVRRRDRQIDTLKKQLGEAGRARGSRGNPAITTISVTGDFGAETSTKKSTSLTTGDHDLRSETNALLAKLAQDLGDENNAMLGSMRRAVERLRQMSGYNSETRADENITRLPGWADLSTELDAVLDHMKNILTNPSFVPIEEVMVREEEIDRLKEGWVKMENRWTEAVHLIDSWRRKMAASGKPVNEEELQMSLRLSPVRIRTSEDRRAVRGLSLAAVAEAQEEEEEAEEELERLQPSPCPSRRQLPILEEEEAEPSGSEDSLDALGHGEMENQLNQDHDMEEANVEILQESTASHMEDGSQESSPLPLPPVLSPLRSSPSAANRRLPSQATKAKPGQRIGGCNAMTEESTADLQPASPPKSAKKSRIPRSPTRNSLEEALLSPVKLSQHTEPGTSHAEPDIGSENHPPEEADSYSSEDELASAPPYKTSRCEDSKVPVSCVASRVEAGQSPLTMKTIAAKLAASEREADAARVRAKLKAFRGAKRPTVTQASESEPAQQQAEEPTDVDPVKHDPVEPTVKPEKRKRDRKASKVSSRRRSTLSPWELNSLISGNVQE